MNDTKTMNDYILETPSMMRENIARHEQLTQDLVREFLKSEFRSITIIASGSSYNACVCAKLYVQKHLKIPVMVITPYTFENYENQFVADSFVMVVSQSGCSTNSIRALEKIKSLNLKTIGLTANHNGDFNSGICDLVVDYGIGEESVGYVTKGMVGIVLYLMLFSLDGALKKDLISKKQLSASLQELEAAVKAHQAIYLEAKSFFERNKKQLLSMTNAYIISAGDNYGCALEGALKIGETVKIPAVAYELEEYIHGPNLQLTPNYNLFFIDNNDECSNHLIDIYFASQAVTDRCYIITNNPRVNGNNVIRGNFQLNGSVGVLSNLAVFEYLAYIISESLDTWANHPLFKEFEGYAKAKTDRYKESYHD